MGCKACMQGCPYDALYLNEHKGTAEKCHFCAHRVERGLEGGPEFLTPRDGYGVDDDFRGAIVRVNRTDFKNRETVFKKIRSFEVQIGEFKDQGAPFEVHFSRTYYYKGMSPFGEVVLPIEEADGLTIRVRIRLHDRTVSNWSSELYKKNTAAAGQLQV